MEKHIVIEGIKVNLTDESRLIPGSVRTKERTTDGVYTDGSEKVIAFSKERNFKGIMSRLCRTVSWVKWIADGRIENIRKIKKRVKEAIWKENF